MRIDTRPVKRTIMEAGNFRVPVGKTIESGTIVHGAMDNFDMLRTQCQGKIEVMAQYSCCSRTMMWINHHNISSTMFQKTSRPQKMKEHYIKYFHVS